jgi:Spy/CpxP family protein refolding chaperone
MRKLAQAVILVFLAASLGWAQDTPAPDAPQPPDPGQVTVRTGGPGGNVMYRRVGQGGPVWFSRNRGFGQGMGMGGWGEGKWWKNPELAKKLNLTDAQVNKMENIFQNHRLQLIDLHANLEKQEVILEPMINADHPNEQQTLEQIDKVAQARAELEKSNARMLFAIRNVLSPEQWKQLQAERDSRRNREKRVEFFRFRGRDNGTGPESIPAPPAPPAPPQQPEE